jgi:NAD(P)-dependent dehydrogenase (short-subunit alcohol dehydrogenase family)
VTGQDEERLKAARATLPADVQVIQSDARSLADATALAETLGATYDGLDIVFLNAGIAQLRPFEAVDEEFYTQHMDTNVKGVVFTWLRLLPLLRPNASVIVNTSVAGLRAAPNMSIYAASKAAVAALARTLAVELAPRGVRVNAIAPAAIHTQIQPKFGLPQDIRAAVERTFCERIPLQRFGHAQEVAALALYLASDAASYMTGVEIPVDGGLSVT